MIERAVFKVLYSPIKAFEDIAKNPSIKGPILVLSLTLLVTAISRIAIASRMFLEVEPNTYVPLFATGMFSSFIVSSMVDAAFIFFMNWVVYAGVLLLMAKMFRARDSSFKTFIIIMGYAFSVFIIYRLISTLLISMLPVARLPVKEWPPAAGETDIVNQRLREAWYPTLPYQLGTYLVVVINAWAVSLCIIALHLLHKTEWKRAAAISLTAYMIHFFILGPFS